MTKRALLSPWDKTGLVELAEGLAELGWELIASGGSARALTDAGLAVTEVAEVTGAPEMLGGRVKTLHPAIHGGILADRFDPSHLEDLQRRGIEPIDLVVGNLYPFRAEPSVEMIDIGGVALARAAAKNFDSVGVVVDPSDYPAVLAELRAGGALSEATRRRLARAAFAHTAAYDAAIVSWFDDGAGTDDGTLPPTVHLALERAAELRYGENPHQAGARYRHTGRPSFWDGVVQHAGLPLSYLNVYDADAAWAMVHDLGDRPAAVIVKHANPCGVSVADDLATAYRRAYECDERSAFGGIVAVNGEIDGAAVGAMVAAAQADVVIAPGYGPSAIEALQAKRRNTRVLEAPPPPAAGLHLRQISDGFLVQTAAGFRAGRDDWQVVTKAAPTEAQWADAELAWRLTGWVRSNAIILVKDQQAVGIGAGQQNRVEAGQIAAAKAAGRAAGGACASDAFYP
ncbi:MAG: bifunctional phosphoribosylaminoimidazolecarboxamide formyltransferase/IMP cyclohydrolase, partial [Actinomycetota bacterium]|nr:bifunctional phosphoribosylaminoimidazolecarboxamide formyltransferase/IMP cyclohydrolase [Actinomycetota bacterium]